MSKKKIIIILIIFIILLCIISGIMYLSKHNWLKEITTVINYDDNLEYQYYQDVYLYDTISITDGRIITDNYKIDTTELGEKDIKINYYDSNNFKQELIYKLAVIDDVNPILSASSNLYIPIGSNNDTVLNKIFCGDNYDREVKLTIEGSYDLNTIGNYNVTFKAVDSEGNTSLKNSVLHVYQPAGESGGNTTYKGTDISYYIKNYAMDDKTSFGLDLSSYQTVEDFNKVKEAGVDFVILRMGWGPDTEEKMTTDRNFEDFYKRAHEAGLKIGVYLFSYAITLEEADLQTDYVLELLKDKEIDLGVAYDWESWNQFRICHMNFVDLNLIAKRFMDNMKDHGYSVMNYGSKYYLENIWNLNGYDTWLAHYNSETSYSKPFKMWQITDQGKVDGINGLVDIDIMYNQI